MSSLPNAQCLIMAPIIFVLSPQSSFISLLFNVVATLAKYPTWHDIKRHGDYPCNSIESALIPLKIFSPET